MATRKPLVIVSGRIQEQPEGDSPAGAEPAIAAPVSAPTEKYWRGDKTWRDFFTDVRAATLTGLSTATNAVITATDTVLSALGRLQKQVSDNLATLTSHTGNTSNPHGVTKVQVGLGDVDNTSDVDKPVSTAQASAIAASTANNIHAATSKSTPVDADELVVSDSAASWGLKKLTFANLKAWIAGLFVSRTNAQVDGNIYVTGRMGVGIVNPQFPLHVPGVSSIANNGNKRVFNSIANNTDWLRLCSFDGNNVPSYVRFVLGSASLHVSFLVELSNGAGGDSIRVKVTLLGTYIYYDSHPMEWRIVQVGINQPGYLDIRFGGSTQQIGYQIFELENVSALSADSASRVTFPCTNVGSASAGFGLKIGTNSGFSYQEFTIFQDKYKRTNLSMVDSTGVIPVNTVVA